MLHLQEELRQTKEKLTQAEEKLADYVRKQEGIDELKSTCTKVELAINTTDASCQTDTVTNIKSCSQTSQCLVKNEGIQIDLQNGCSSEEVAEIIREFSEKIDQMQELHAAEIMDMETRHISESEALKRDKFAAVQQLTEERNALKGVIGALSDKEVCVFIYNVSAFHISLESLFWFLAIPEGLPFMLFADLDSMESQL